MTIRPATLGDCAALNTINRESLGYSTPVEITADALKTIIAQKDILFVLEQQNVVVGYVHATSYQTLYHAPLVNVLGLAILTSEQGHGYGRLLMQALEEKTKARGFVGIRLNSGSERTAAHQFYEHLGYDCTKTQKRFFKAL